MRRAISDIGGNATTNSTIELQFCVEIMAKFGLSFLTGRIAAVLICWLLTLDRTSGSICPQIGGNQTTCAYFDDEIYVPSGLNRPLVFTNVSGIANNVTLRLSNMNQNVTLNCSAITQSITCHTNGLLVTKESKTVYHAELLSENQTTGMISLHFERNTTVTVYNCSKLGELGCNYCKALNSSRYTCAWNTTTQTCMFNDGLNDSARQSVQCHPPIIKRHFNILQIHPKDGPYGGSVTVTLTGSEFGVVENNIIILSTVVVSGKHCGSNVKDIKYISYDPSDFMRGVRTGFTCRATGGILGNETTFKLGADLQAKVSIPFDPFVLKNSTITRVYPDYGPRAGGTRITLYGDNLGIGNMNLETVQVQGQELIGFNISSVNNGSGDVYVIIGTIPTRENNESYTGTTSFIGSLNDVDLINETVTFTFLDDPVIEDLKPTHGFLSGGTVLTVTGTHLTHANRPVIFIRNDTQTETPCELMNSTTAYCKVPEAPGWIKQTLNSTRRKRATTCDGCQEVEIVVKLDGVERSFTLKYYHDPSLSKFNNGLQLFSVEQQYLTIEGNNLQLLAPTDVNITIGIAECKNVEIQNNTMRCAAPRQQPAPGVPGAEFPEVNVTIGNTKQSLGYLKYEITVENIALIVGASVGPAVLVIVIVSVVVFVTTRRRRANTKRKQMLVDMMTKEIKDVELEDKIRAKPEEDQPKMKIEHENEFLN